MKFGTKIQKQLKNVECVPSRQAGTKDSSDQNMHVQSCQSYFNGFLSQKRKVLFRFKPDNVRKNHLQFF